MITVYEVQIKFEGPNFVANITKNGRQAWDRTFTGATDDLVLSEFLNYIEGGHCPEEVISVGTIMKNTMDQRVRVIARS